MTESPNKKDAPRDPFTNEEEIHILEQRLQLLREGRAQSSPETAKVPESHEQEKRGEFPTAVPLPPTVTPTPLAGDDQHFHDAKVGELKTYESDKQIKALVEIALERSLADAVNIARRLDDAYLLDALHDVLIDDEKLHQHLVVSGKLKEV